MKTNNNKLEHFFQKNGLILMDGATGTEILRRGYSTELPLWSAEILLSQPEVVKEIHKDYIKAGAEIIITNTFRTTERSLKKKGVRHKAGKLTRLACKLARAAIEEVKSQHEVFIAGSVAPLEDCYSPELTPNDQELAKEHLEHAKNLKKGGVDFLLIETMITIRESKFAIQAARKLDMPFAVSFCLNEKMDLLSGEWLEDAAREIEKYKPLFIGINCVSRKIAEDAVRYLRAITKLPICVYAQGDDSDFYENHGAGFNDIKNLDSYLESARKWARDGAIIIGGCCGTTPLYIEKLKESLGQKKEINNVMAAV